MGNQMMMVAMGWQLYKLTSGASDFGLVGLDQFLPALVVTLPAGHAADRGDRGHILALCNVAGSEYRLLFTAAAGAAVSAAAPDTARNGGELNWHEGRGHRRPCFA